MYTCAQCTVKACESGNLEKAPRNCPLRDTEILEKSRSVYTNKEFAEIARQAAKTEYEGYCRQTRIEEIMSFARGMKYKKIGIAHCVGFSKEAAIAARVFKANGFEVDTVCCKCSAITKDEMGMGQWRLEEGYETICNPVGQTLALEKAGCDLAVVMGLCVGHDTMFLKSCSLPVTYLVTKDRVTGHNPVAAIYLADSYYHKKLFGE